MGNLPIRKMIIFPYSPYRSYQAFFCDFPCVPCSHIGFLWHHITSICLHICPSHLNCELLWDIYLPNTYLHSWQKRGSFCSVAKSCPTLCDPMDCSIPGFPVLQRLPEFAQTHVHWIGDAIQPSHPLFSLSPPALNLPHHQDLFKWVSSSHQVAKVLEFQLQHQSFQRIFKTDFV